MGMGLLKKIEWLDSTVSYSIFRELAERGVLVWPLVAGRFCLVPTDVMPADTFNLAKLAERQITDREKCKT